MDIKDKEQGATKDFFWFKAKCRLVDILIARLAVQNRMKILSIGTGTGEELAIFNHYGDVYVADMNQEILNSLPDHMAHEKRLASIEALPYQDNFFDAVGALDVFEHVKHDSAAIAEIRRVLKPGGYVIFTVPAFNALYSGRDRALGHYRRYNRKTIDRLLCEMKKVDLGFWFCFLFVPVAIERILKRHSRQWKFHFKAVSPVLNTVLYYLLSLENLLIKKGIHLPWGITLYGMYKKPRL
ncbi:MAG: methyltransferase domain-containing protein [Elusimicrobia bacterium]|nr:methyltransferase domain-containing protein [Elusimicrobiota bacterium]MBD3412772.1 methyltransferase domain-containing protein [Elusimicrobiota bacterium]